MTLACASPQGGHYHQTTRQGRRQAQIKRICLKRSRRSQSEGSRLPDTPSGALSHDQDPQETCAGQDFRDAKMNQCGQRLRDRSPRGRSQPERVRRIGAPMSVSEKDTRDVARIWTDRRIPAACRGAVFHDQIVESSWSRSPRLSRVKSIFPCRPCMAIAWADISAVMSPRQYLGMAVRSEETSTIQPDVVRHQRGAQSRPFSEPRDRTASGAGTSGRPSGTLPVQPARNML